MNEYHRQNEFRKVRLIMSVLNMNVHFKCNAKCIFCVVGIPLNYQHGATEINYEEIVEELKLGFDKGHNELVLSGGEPTIHPDLIRIVKKAKEIGYVNVEVKTNGIKLCDLEFVEELADAGVETFCISVQGPNAKLHDYVLGVDGAFDAVIKACEHIKRVGKTLVTPTCIQAANYKYLPQTVDLLISIGSKHCLPTFIEPNGSALKNFRSVVPTYSEVMPYLAEAIEILKNSDVSWNLHGFPMCLIKGYEARSLDLFRVNHRIAGTEIDDYNDYEKEKFRMRDNKCQKCILYSVCGGPWANYVKIYGSDELEPVTSGSVTDIIPVQTLVNCVFT